MRPSWCFTALVACLPVVATGCKREESLGTLKVSDPRFDEQWRALAGAGDREGDEVFYIEDDRGEGLMGRVRRSRQTAPRPAPPPAAEPPPAAAPAGEPVMPTGDEVSAVVRSNMAAVKVCYLRIARSSGRSVSGRAIVSFTVGKDGVVENVRVDAPAFAETELPTCVSEQVKRWSFPKSTKGGLAVSYPFVFVGG